MQRPASSSSSSDQSDTISHTSILAFQLPPVATSLNEGPDGTFIRERLAGFNKMLRQLHLATNKSNDSMQKLSKLQKRITSDTAEDTPANRDRLNTLYRSSVKDTETEAELTRQAMDTIFDIRALMKQRQKKLMYNMNSQNQIRRGQLMKILSDCANTLPLYIGRSITEKPPPLVGAIPAENGHIAKIGDLVAAMTKVTSQGGQEDTWILAEVVHFDETANKYEVDDIDEEMKERHTVARRKILPLPNMRANPETDPEALFPKGTFVLALYPQTTCFYKAVVQDPPKTASDSYHVLFEDATYQEGYSPPLEVPQRYVIRTKEQAKGSKGGKSR